jgi:hypothetical protein
MSLAQNFLEQHQAVFKAAGAESWKGQSKKKGPERGRTLESCVLSKTGDKVGYLWNRTEKARERVQDWHRELCTHSFISCSSQLSPPSRKECLVSSSGNDNTENGLPGSKAEEKPPTKV